MFKFGKSLGFLKKSHSLDQKIKCLCNSKKICVMDLGRHCINKVHVSYITTICLICRISAKISDFWISKHFTKYPGNMKIIFNLYLLLWLFTSSFSLAHDSCPSETSESQCRVKNMSFVPVPVGSDFPLENLPYGIFSTSDNVSQFPLHSNKGITYSFIVFSGQTQNRRCDWWPHSWSLSNCSSF